MEHTAGLHCKTFPRLRESFRQVEAEEESNSRNKIHQTWEQPYRDSLYKRKCYEVPKSFFKEEEESTVNYKSNDGGNVNVVAVTDNEYYGGGEPGEVHVKGWQYLSQLTQIL